MQESSLKGIREYPAESRAAKAIRETFESGRPITYIRADDERRVAGILREVAQTLAVPGFHARLDLELDRRDAPRGRGDPASH
jgi:hypothetical protein